MRTELKPLCCSIAVLVAAALGGTGCGNSVGGGCSKASDCPSGEADGGTIQAVCLTGTASPGGYCAIPCITVGAQDVCPSGSYCTLLTAGNFCAHICQTQSDCRTGYNCNGTGASGTKTCQ
jgi:hypothetical protein